MRKRDGETGRLEVVMTYSTYLALLYQYFTSITLNQTSGSLYSQSTLTPAQGGLD